MAGTGQNLELRKQATAQKNIWVGRLKEIIRGVFSLFTKFFEWLLLIILALATVAATAFVILWLTDSLTTQDRSNRQQRMDPISLISGGVLKIDSPATLYIADKPFSILITRESRSSLTSPLEIQVQIPKDIILVSPPEQARYSTPTFFFPEALDHVQTITLTVVNARLLDSTSQRQITITPTGEKEQPLVFWVEGAQEANVRGFVAGVLGDKSPLFIFVTALTSAAGLLLTKWLEREKLTLELEKQKSDIEKERKDKETALQKRKGFLELLCRQEIPEARQVRGELQSHHWENHLPQSDRDLAEKLLAITTGDLSDLSFSQMTEDWIGAAAGALVFLVENNPPDKNALRRTLRSFPTNKLDANLREAVEKAQSKLVTEPLQLRLWPKRLGSFDRKDIELGGKNGDQDVNAIGEQLGKVNPFPFERTENELALLYGGDHPAVWREHPQYGFLNNTSNPCLVLGVPGTGKTAMAMSLGEHLDTDQVFAIYMDGLPQFLDIQVAFATKLLNFVQSHPTWLDLLGKDEREMLAHLFAIYPGKRVALAEVNAEIDSGLRGQWEWPKEAKDEATKKIWEDDGSTQLELLREAIANLDPQPTLSPHQWVAGLVRCARSLRFERVRLVVDTREQKWQDWFQSSMLPNFQTWMNAGLSVLIFARQDPQDKLNMIHDLINAVELNWRESDLENMILWRYQQIADLFQIRKAVTDLFEGKAFPKLISAANGNPRCLIRLWNQIVTLNPPEGAVTEQIVEIAKGQISCP